MWSQKWAMKKLAQINIENVYHYHHSRQIGKGFCRFPLTTVLILSLVTPIFFFTSYQRNIIAPDDARGNVRAVVLTPGQNAVVEDTPSARLGQWGAEERRPTGRGTLGFKQPSDDWTEDDDAWAEGRERVKHVDEVEGKPASEEKPKAGEPMYIAAVTTTNGEVASADVQTDSTQREETPPEVEDDGSDSPERRDARMDDEEGKEHEPKVEETEMTDISAGVATLGEGAKTLDAQVAVIGPPAAPVQATTPVDTSIKVDTSEVGTGDNYRTTLISRIEAQIPLSDELMEFARERSNTPLITHLQSIKDRCLQAVEKLGDGSMDIEAGNNVVRVAELATLRGKELRTSTIIIEKLRKEVQESKDKMKVLTKERNILDLVAAKSLPKGLHCLSMQLTIAYYNRTDAQPITPSPEVLEDTSRYHYALFSDNVLAASVVVKSLVQNVKDPSRHVIHLVTDAMNKPAMIEWFRTRSPHPAVIDIKTVEDFSDWLTPDHCPVLKFLQESKTLQSFYNNVDGPTTKGGNEGDEKGIKHRNPKYLSMLNHLRFYLPEVYPKLKKVVFLDDDIVIQKDLAPLFEVDLEGNVNGAVFTCRGKFHRLGHYLNFSHPAIKSEFDEDACGWAYGMNVFDLDRWREENLTEVYHRWQKANEDRLLWKLGTLPPGLLTFYKRTHPLDKSWHQLGLGYDPEVTHDLAKNSAVVHYNGNNKPWLDIAMPAYRSYWTTYVNEKDPLVLECNINVGKNTMS